MSHRVNNNKTRMQLYCNLAKKTPLLLNGLLLI